MTRTATTNWAGSPPEARTARHMPSRSGARSAMCVAALPRVCAPRHVRSAPSASLLVCSSAHLPSCASARAGGGA